MFEISQTFKKLGLGLCAMVTLALRSRPVMPLPAGQAGAKAAAPAKSERHRGWRAAAEER